MNILITGANGFLGRLVARKCIDNCWPVTCLYHHGMENIPGGCSRLHISEINQCQETDFDIIFHFAAHIPWQKMNLPDQRMINADIRLTLLLCGCFPAAKIIYASSVSVYGMPTGIITENSAFNNPSIYGLTKLGGEAIVRHHPAFAILRFSSLYGRGMKRKTFLPQIIDHARTTGKIKLSGKGDRLQDYLHVTDATAYCIHAALYGQNEAYLGVFGQSRSNLEVAETIRSFFPGCSIGFAGDDSQPSYKYDQSYTVSRLGYAPRISLADGIMEILEDG